MYKDDFDPLAMLTENTVMIERLIKGHNNHDELLVAYSQNNADLAKLVKKQDIRIRSLENQMKVLVKYYETLAASTNNS